MGGWGTLIKEGAKTAAKYAGKGAKKGWNDAAKPLWDGYGKSIGRNIVGTAAVTAMGAGGVRYLITGQGILGQAKDMFFGKPDSDASETDERGNSAVSMVTNTSGQASETSEKSLLDEGVEMISNFLGGGSGANSFWQMIQNFGSNLFSGKMSGMSMAGLVLSGLLIFGRGGLLGKIAGALLAMMIVAMNSDNKVQQQTGGRAVRPAQEANRAAGLDADTIQTQMQSNYEQAASGAEQAVEMNQHRG